MCLPWPLGFLPSSKEIKINKFKYGYLESEEIPFPDYMGIEEACEGWNISRDILIRDIEGGRIGIKDGKISRLGLIKYL